MSAIIPSNFKYFLIYLGIFAFSCNPNTQDNKEPDKSVNQERVVYSEAELSDETLAELRILRNEIYARHGYIFKSEDLREYFLKFEWYKPEFEEVNHLLTENDKDNIKLILSIENKLSSVPLSEKLLGQWLNVKYINKIKQTKSAREGQRSVRTAYIEFLPNGQAEVIINFHEGVTYSYYLQNDTIKFKTYLDSDVFGLLLDRFILLYREDDKTDTLKFFNVTSSANTNIALNKLIFEGNYRIIESYKAVEFRSNGDLIGLDHFEKYQVFDDYYDAGMNMDLMILKSSEKDVHVTWKFHSDTLKLFKVKCIEFDTMYNHCYTFEKGDLLYELKKLL